VQILDSGGHEVVSLIPLSLVVFDGNRERPSNAGTAILAIRLTEEAADDEATGPGLRECQGCQR